jgi:tyrosine-protein phosphatase OCA6
MLLRFKVVPPFRFAIVEDGVYRGAYPTLKNCPHLKSLKLKTIISLIPEPPTLDLDDFCAINGIDLIHYMGKSCNSACSFLMAS